MTRAADLAKLIAGGGTITVADNSTNITLKSTDDDANGGPVFDLTRDSASPADSDTMGTIRFRSDDDGGNETQFVDITGFAPDVSDGSEDGQLQIRTIVGGTLRNRLDLASGETVFNEDSQSIDFRVESDASSHGIFLDASEPSVGFGVGTADTVTAKMAIGLTGTVTAGDTDGATIGKASHVRLIDDTNWSSTNSTIFILGGGTGGAVGQISSAIGFARESNTHWGTQLKFYTHPADTSDLDELDEHMRIDATGNKIMNPASTASQISAGSHSGSFFAPAGQYESSRATTSTSTHVTFRNTNGGVGTINTSGSSTAYNTSSDYRLKENVVTDWDATTRLKKLKPSRFNFKVDADTTVDGFLAHEVSDIVPEAISGVKDETQDVGTIKDKDGNVLQENVLESEKKDGQTWTKTKTENVYQGIDHSKLVPLMVKTIQELEARIATLESK